MTTAKTQANAGLVVLLDHARRVKPAEPRHYACRGCRLGHGHNPAVTR